MRSVIKRVIDHEDTRFKIGSVPLQVEGYRKENVYVDNLREPDRRWLGDCREDPLIEGIGYNREVGNGGVLEQQGDSRSQEIFLE